MEYTATPLIAETPGAKIAQIFGTFFIDKTEFAISVENVQEVINYPDSISVMPLAPDFLDGVFNLRGVIVPILNLSRLLKISPGMVGAATKVAILNYGFASVGLAFDRTGEIIRPMPEERSEYQYKDGSIHRVIKGALKLNGGSRLLQVLDPAALVSIENVPQLLANDQTQVTRAAALRERVKLRKKCITFTVSNVRLAFEITGIYEILSVPEIQASPLASELWFGMINLRKYSVPVLSFANIIGRPTHQVEPANQRIIVIKIEQELFGLLVDSVESIDSYSIDAVMPLPLLNQAKKEIFVGCISVPEQGDVFLLDHKKILNDKEVFEITQGHARLYQVDAVDELKVTREAQKKYISFSIHHHLGVPIEDVREIINFSREVIDAPGMPEYVLGILNLRGRIVTIIDARELYQIKEDDSVNIAEKKIMVFQKNDDLYGLVVDSVESIISIDTRDKLKLPEILTRTHGSLDQDVTEVFETSKSGPLIVLNVVGLIERIKRGVARR
jgi:purine-binding chemotaxis protein CheW